MTNKSTDTLKQIMKKPIKTVWSIDDNGYKKEYLSFESANEILAIAIKSPEAAEYWLDKAIEAVNDEFEPFESSMWNRCYALKRLEALKEAQRDS